MMVSMMNDLKDDYLDWHIVSRVWYYSSDRFTIITKYLFSQSMWCRIHASCDICVAGNHYLFKLLLIGQSFICRIHSSVVPSVETSFHECIYLTLMTARTCESANEVSAAELDLSVILIFGCLLALLMYAVTQYFTYCIDYRALFNILPSFTLIVVFVVSLIQRGNIDSRFFVS